MLAAAGLTYTQVVEWSFDVIRAGCWYAFAQTKRLNRVDTESDVQLERKYALDHRVTKIVIYILMDFRPALDEKLDSLSLYGRSIYQTARTMNIGETFPVTTPTVFLISGR